MTQERDGLCNCWFILILRNLAFKPFVIHFDKKEHKRVSLIERKERYPYYCGRMSFGEQTGAHLGENYKLP